MGRSTIDCFGLQEGVLPLNGLNYRPGQWAQSTYVCDSHLLELNRDFLRDPLRRPDFFLFQFGSIDNRFITQDDGLALQELLYGFGLNSSSKASLFTQSPAPKRPSQGLPASLLNSEK